MCVCSRGDGADQATTGTHAVASRSHDVRLGPRDGTLVATVVVMLLVMPTMPL